MKVFYQSIPLFYIGYIFQDRIIDYGAQKKAQFSCLYRKYLKQGKQLQDIEKSISLIKEERIVEKFNNENKKEEDVMNVNLEGQLQQLKEKRLIGLKGPYGSGTTFQSLKLASEWSKQNSQGLVMYFRPPGVQTGSTLLSTFLSSIQCKDEHQFHNILTHLKNNNQQLLLIFDNIDILDFNANHVKYFFQFLNNLHDQKLLLQLYLLKTNKAEKNLQLIHENSINMNFLGKGIFMEHQLPSYLQFVQNSIGYNDIQSSKKFLFFFGVNYKILQDLKSFIQFNKSVNNLDLTIDGIIIHYQYSTYNNAKINNEFYIYMKYQNNLISNIQIDFIDLKVDKLVQQIQQNNYSQTIMKICKFLDSGSGIFINDWKNALSYQEIEKLENDDILQIQGTTNALHRAAIGKICKQNWRKWNLNEWKGNKFNVNYNL